MSRIQFQLIYDNNDDDKEKLFDFIRDKDNDNALLYWTKLILFISFFLKRCVAHTIKCDDKVAVLYRMLNWTIQSIFILFLWQLLYQKGEKTDSTIKWRERKETAYNCCLCLLNAKDFKTVVILAEMCLFNSVSFNSFSRCIPQTHIYCVFFLIFPILWHSYRQHLRPELYPWCILIYKCVCRWAFHSLSIHWNIYGHNFVINCVSLEHSYFMLV